MMGKVAIWAFIIGALVALLVGLWQAYTIEQNQQPAFMTDMGGMDRLVISDYRCYRRNISRVRKRNYYQIRSSSVSHRRYRITCHVCSLQQGFSISPWIGSLLSGVSMSLAIFIAPAVGILAIKAIWDIGKDV